MRKAFIAAFTPLILLFSVPTAAAQELPAAVAEKLAVDKTVLEFTVRPEKLALLPGFPGAGVFRERHAALNPHFSQEGLFILPGNTVPVDIEAARRLLAAIPTLAGLSATDERNGQRVRLFTEASLVGEPAERDGSLSFIVKTADVDFGTARFQVNLVCAADRVEMRMVNLDSLHFLIFPSVHPGKALVDLVYFPGERESLIYIAWSVRAVISVPGFIPVDRPLRYRALALKDWYVKQIESVSK